MCHACARCGPCAVRGRVDRPEPPRGVAPPRRAAIADSTGPHPMSIATRRFAPRSAVSAADLAPLAVARLDFADQTDEPVRSVLDLARRFVRVVASPQPDEVTTVVVLGKASPRD